MLLLTLEPYNHWSKRSGPKTNTTKVRETNIVENTERWWGKSGVGSLQDDETKENLKWVAESEDYSLNGK